MPSLAKALARRLEGLSLAWQFADMCGLKLAPRFAGVSLAAPDATTAWTVVMQIAGGEYRWPGFTPKRGWRVVDIGANIGVYSLWANRLGATVTAIEPEPRTFAALVANSRGRFRTVQAAVVSAPMPTTRLYLSGVRSTRHTLLAAEMESGEPLESFVDVPALTLDSAVGERCDLLKLDCEGAEFPVILSAEDATLRRASRIILEFHRVAGEPTQLVERLDAAGLNTSFVAGSARGAAVGLITASLHSD